jgi:hypothetical protein
MLLIKIMVDRNLMHLKETTMLYRMPFTKEEYELLLYMNCDDIKNIELILKEVDLRRDNYISLRKILIRNETDKIIKYLILFDSKLFKEIFNEQTFIAKFSIPPAVDKYLKKYYYANLPTFKHTILVCFRKHINNDVILIIESYIDFVELF